MVKKDDLWLPCYKSIFVQNKLYLFTERAISGSEGTPLFYERIEEVYVLDMSKLLLILLILLNNKVLKLKDGN